MLWLTPCAAWGSTAPADVAPRRGAWQRMQCCISVSPRRTYIMAFIPRAVPGVNHKGVSPTRAVGLQTVATC